jgi:hypothetical protein
MLKTYQFPLEFGLQDLNNIQFGKETCKKEIESARINQEIQ